MNLNWLNILITVAGGLVLYAFWYFDLQLVLLAFACFFWGMAAGRFFPARD